jgi:hypothetical protein
MRASSRQIIAGAAVALAAAAAVAPSAFADSGGSSSTTAVPSTTAGADTLAAIKAKGAAAISARDSALQAAISAVTANRHLTSSDGATVLSTLNADLSGLNALAPVIQADTTVSKARADYTTIFTNYRVFALALPQARLAAAADDLTGTVLPRLTDAQSRLQARLSGKDSGKNTGSVQAAMADLANQISAITSATNGLSATVLGYTPAQWNANHALLTQPRSALVTARGDARTARKDIKTVVEALR